jgi:hypothetical protein
MAPRHVSAYLNKKMKTSVKYAEFYLFPKFIFPQAFPPSTAPTIVDTSYHRQQYAQLHLRISGRSPSPVWLRRSRKSTETTTSMLRLRSKSDVPLAIYRQAQICSRKQVLLFLPRYAINYRCTCKS